MLLACPSSCYLRKYILLHHLRCFASSIFLTFSFNLIISILSFTAFGSASLFNNFLYNQKEMKNFRLSSLYHFLYSYSYFRITKKLRISSLLLFYKVDISLILPTINKVNSVIIYTATKKNKKIFIIYCDVDIL